MIQKMEARFVSKGSRFSMGIRGRIAEEYATGGSKELVAHLEAQFSPNGVSEDDYKTAMEHLRKRFTGLPMDRDTEEHVSIRSRLGVWDSRIAKDAGMSDKDADLVIEALRKSNQYGLMFVEVEVVRAPKPWPKYDELDGRQTKRLLDKIAEDGYDPAAVLAYEQENENKPAFVKALTDLIENADPADEEVVIHA